MIQNKENVEQVQGCLSLQHCILTREQNENAEDDLLKTLMNVVTKKETEASKNNL